MPDLLTDADVGLLSDEDVGLGGEEYTDAEREAILSGPGIPAWISDTGLKPGEASLSAYNPTLKQRIRRSAVAERLFGPEVHEEGAPYPGGYAPIGVAAEKMLEFTSPPPPVQEAIQYVTDPLIESIPNETVRGIVEGGRNVAMTLPLAPFGASAKVAMPIFAGEYASNLPEAKRAYREALARGETREAAKQAAETVISGLLIGAGTAHELSGKPVITDQVPRIEGEFGKPIGEPNAIQERSAEALPVGETPGGGKEVGARIPESETPTETQAPVQQTETKGGETTLEDPHGVIADESERNLFQQFTDRAVEGGLAKMVRVLRDAGDNPGLKDRAMAYTPGEGLGDGAIEINRDALLKDLSRYEPGSEAQFQRLDTIFKHEEGHGAVDAHVTPDQAGEFWRSLPKVVQSLFGKFYGEWPEGYSDNAKGHEYLRHVRDWALGEDPYKIFESKGLKSITQRAINLTLRAIHEAQKRLPTKGGERLRATLAQMEGKLKTASAIKARGGDESFSAPKTSEELDQIKEDEIRARMKAGIKPEDIKLTVNKLGLPEGKGDYVQADEVHPELGNTFSSNPDQLRSLGMNMPTMKEVLDKMPSGQYTLTEVRQKLAAPAGSKGKAHFDSYQYGKPKFTVASGPGGKYVSHISPEEAVQKGYTVPDKYPTEREWRMGKGGESFSAPKSKTQVEAEKRKGKADLKEVLRRAQEAGRAGRVAGREEKAAQLRPAIADLKAQLNNSITKAQALAENLRGQETGSALGAAAAKTKAINLDRWLAADAENIRDSLTGLVNELPASERGRFTQAITQAMKRPPLFSKGVNVGGQRIGVIENMYRKAAQVAARIEDRISQVEINGIKADISDFSKLTDSPKIDVPYRKAIRTVLGQFEQLKKAGDIPKDALVAMRDTLTSLKDIGRSEQNVKEALWSWQNEFALERLKAQPTRPMESRPEVRPVPGEKMTASMKLRNWINKARDKAAIVDKALSPIDALFDLMEDAKGKYQGWLFRHARGPIDLAFNNYALRRNRLIKAVDDHIRSSKLTARNGERIGVYAQNLQEGGRQRMIDSGLAPATIDRIVNSLTPAEKTAYRLMREAMDSQLPEVQDLMQKLYNTEVKPVPNYFPMPRDWRVFEDKPAEAPAPGTETGFDDLATWKDLRDDFFPRDTTQARKGFTIERQEGAKTPVRIDAFDIFRQHINDVAYLIEHQPDLKRLGELGRSDEFKAKYGDMGQKIFLDWLDSVARQGTADSFRHWKFLDTIRKNTSVGIIGFRLGSQLVHLSNTPYIMARIGHWFGTGLRESFTERGQRFITDHFGEVKERSGGEPAQAEAEKEGLKFFGQTVIPAGGVRFSMVLARMVDRMNAQGSAMGTYLKILKDKGVNWRDYDRIPVDQDAINKALVLTRRAIASPLPKDVPQALSRGAITGGNVSFGRTLFQFQNIFLDQWSNIRHDLFQAGIVGKNPKLAAAMFLAVAGATYLETQIKENTKKALNKVTGKPEPVKEQPSHSFLTELIRRFPFGGQISNAIQYDETGVPIIDATTDVLKKAKQTYKSPYPISQKIGALRTVGAAASLAGIPGASQVTDLAANVIRGATETPAQKVNTMAKRFMESEGTARPKIEQGDDPSYNLLRVAVRSGDYKKAKKIMDQLGDTKGYGKVYDAMEQNSNKPFTISDQQEQRFKSKLNDKDLELYDKAVEQRKKEFQDFIDNVWSK